MAGRARIDRPGSTAHPDSVPDAYDPARMRRAWRTLSVVSLASILTALNGSALNVALPEVVRHFHASSVASTWVLLSAQLTSTTLMVVFGRLADIFGRRAMYLCGLAVYIGASLLLGLSPGVWWLVGLRVVQAAGSAMLITNSAAIVTDVFPRRSLGTGLGIYTASFSVAQLVGPTLGGFLAHQLGWEWVFWYNVPLGVICMAWGVVALRPSAPSGQARRMDVPGIALVLLSLGSLLFALTQVTELGWASPLVLGGLLACAVLLPVFVFVEMRSPAPVIDLRLFAEPALGFGVLASFLNAMARFAVILLTALFFQAVAGETPLQAGLRVLPLAVAAMLASPIAGLAMRRVRARTMTLVGTGLTTLGLGVLLLSVSESANYPAFLPGLLLIGAGSGAFMPSNTAGMMHGLPADRVGIVNAVRLMMQNVGNVVSVALAMSIVTSPLPAELRRYVFAGTVSGISPDTVGRLVTGYHWALGCLTLVSACAVAASYAARHAAATHPHNPGD